MVFVIFWIAMVQLVSVSSSGWSSSEFGIHSSHFNSFNAMAAVSPAPFPLPSSARINRNWKSIGKCCFIREVAGVAKLTILSSGTIVLMMRFNQPSILGWCLYTEPSMAMVTSLADIRRSKTAVVIDTKRAARCETIAAIYWTIRMSSWLAELKPLSFSACSVRWYVPLRLSL